MKIPEIQFTPKIHQDIGIEIIELCDLYENFTDAKLNFSTKPHRISFHNLLYITEGQGTHFVDFNTYSIQAGSVVFIDKSQIHAFDPASNVQGKLVIFTDEYLQNISSTMKIPVFSSNHLLTSYTPTLSLSDELKETCNALFFEIEKEYQLVDPNLSFLNLLFSAVITKLTNARPQSNQQNISESRIETFSKFVRLLEVNYTQVRDAKVYADMIGLTYKSLNEICKLATKQTAKQLIDAFITLEAKRKLSIDDIRVQQLADELGFDEVTNFVKYFKKNTLLTPSQFKKIAKG